MKGLPAENQKELVRLLVREISVNHFDPEAGKEPNEKGMFNTKIRTKCNAIRGFIGWDAGNPSTTFIFSREKINVADGTRAG